MSELSPSEQADVDRTFHAACNELDRLKRVLTQEQYAALLLGRAYYRVVTMEDRADIPEAIREHWAKSLRNSMERYGPLFEARRGGEES